MNKDWRQSPATRLFTAIFAILFLWFTGVSLLVVLLNVAIGFAGNEADFCTNFLIMTENNEYDQLYNYIQLSVYQMNASEPDEEIPESYGMAENIHTYETHFDPKNTNFRFAVTNAEGECILSNDPLYGKEQATLASNVSPENFRDEARRYQEQRMLLDPVENFADFIHQDPKDMLDNPNDYQLWYFYDNDVDNAYHQGVPVNIKYHAINDIRFFHTEEEAKEFDYASVYGNNMRWHIYGDKNYTDVDEAIDIIGTQYDVRNPDGAISSYYAPADEGVPVVISTQDRIVSSTIALGEYYNYKKNKTATVTAQSATLEKKLNKALQITIVANSNSYSTLYIRTYLPENLPVNDTIRTNFSVFQFLFKRSERMVLCLFISLTLAVISCIAMCCSAGHSTAYAGVHASRVHRMSFEIFWALPITALLGSIYVFFKLVGINTPYRTLALFAVGMVCIIATAIVLLIYTVAVRIKTDTFWSSFGLMRLTVYFISLMRGHISVSIIVTLWLIVLALLNTLPLVFFRRYMVLLVPVAILCDIATLAFVLYSIYSYFELHKHVNRMETGDFSPVSHRIPLTADFQRFDNSLGDITSRVEEIVAKQTKAEHLRTELITNVSHDLKTPLTSICNYVDLLSREPMQSEAASEYLDVLRRQAARLKKLTVDLVDASKASTGNLTVELVPTDLQVLIGQLAGEYEEQLAQRQLSFILNVPDEPTIILADGRQIWRVFDNLLGNACKYALSGTRVYMDLRSDGKLAEITLKNVSAHPLNVSPDELMERFVRGDASRHTEGSGLGLAIARDLVSLQHGLLELSTDGDLFKVTLSFPVHIPPEEPAPEPVPAAADHAAAAIGTASVPAEQTT